MTLNGTIIVQLINFIIAYFIIDRLLLRKAVALIQQECTEQDNLMKDIQKERDYVSDNEEQKKLEWEQFFQQFKQESPKIIERPSFKKFERIPKIGEKLPSIEVKRTTNELKDLLIE